MFDLMLKLTKTKNKFFTKLKFLDTNYIVKEGNRSNGILR
jgi:hypothetical protein